jgi:hypothetical protein
VERAAFLRPSSAAIWVVCNGYAAMRAAYPEVPEEADDDVREDGIACHWLAAELFHGRFPPLNSLSPNNRTLDEDMFDGADMYLDVLRQWSGVAPVVEQPIDCSAIYPGMSGTPDAWAYNPTLKTLYVADLKYGFRFVEVWENWQLVIYAWCLLTLLGLNDLDTTIELTIVQPRSNHKDGPVRKWRVRASDLRAQVNIIKGAAAEAMKPTPFCTPNSGCGDCPARHACVALQNAALRALEVSYQGVPLELTPAAIGDELRRLKEAEKRIEARVTGLTMQAEQLLRTGSHVPHWTLQATYAREKWREGSEAQVLRLAEFFHVDVAKPVQPISPAQARKVLPVDIVATFAHKPSTGVRLTKLDPYAAKKAFQP